MVSNYNDYNMDNMSGGKQCHDNGNSGDGDIIRSSYELSKRIAVHWNDPQKTFVGMVARHRDQV